MTRRSDEDILGPAAVGYEEPPRSSDAVIPSRARRGGDFAIVGSAHEGASRTSREIALWTPALRSGDADTIRDRDIATARSRDILRNDSYAQSAESLHRDSIVGSAFLLNARPVTSVLGIDDEKWEEEFQEEVETKFSIWAESPDNWPDASRMNTLTGLVRLAVGVYLANGEVLAVAEWIRNKDRPLNTAIQMIELDRLSNPFGGGVLVPNMRGGVEIDSNGAPIAYHIRKAHPSDVAFNMNPATEWTRFPARMSWGRQRVIHILEQTRISQHRGISAMVSALKEMRMTKKFRDIELQNAVVQATYAATIESDLPRQEVNETLGVGDNEALLNYIEDYLAMCSDYSTASAALAIDGVKIPHLVPGTKLQLRPAGKGGARGTEFEASLLRYIAANLGVSYEQLSRDYSKSNYSSIRAAIIETWKYMQSRKKMVADRFASHIYRLWFEEMWARGEIESIKGRPDFFEGMNKDAYTACEWLGAGRGQIDELKETQAAILRVKANLSTFEQEFARQGLDWRRELRQRAREQKLVKDLDLLPPEEDRGMNAVNGTPREQRNDGTEVEDDSDE